MRQQLEILSFLYFPVSPSRSSTYSAAPGTHHENMSYCVFSKQTTIL